MITDLNKKINDLENNCESKNRDDDKMYVKKEEFDNKINELNNKIRELNKNSEFDYNMKISNLEDQINLKEKLINDNNEELGLLNQNENYTLNINKDEEKDKLKDDLINVQNSINDLDERLKNTQNVLIIK